jgi:signal transduction histidine kinase
MNDLYAAVIHDVKNKLAELSLRLDERGDAQAEMGIAINASNRLSEMLLMHRHQSQHLTINAVSVNATDFLSILAAEYKELFPNIIIALQINHAPEFSFFDDALVRMALGNALHNACRVANNKVILFAETVEGMLALGVKDDGSGYPSQILQAGGESPSTISNRGTGLGLYLARQIAELHRLESRQGRIELSNDGGAVFRMLLP